MKKISKVTLLISIAFFYLSYVFFAPTFWTRTLYPYQCKGIIGDIDPSPLHILMYIVMGFYFRFWSIVLSFIEEILNPIYHKHFEWIDLAYNFIGSIIGIKLAKHFKNNIKRQDTVRNIK